jgi:hypothetical protein
MKHMLFILPVTLGRDPSDAAITVNDQIMLPKPDLSLPG